LAEKNSNNPRLYALAALLGLLGSGLRPLSAAEQSFPVMEYRVLHNTVLSQRAVEEAVYPHLGPGKTLQDVQAARAALEKAYHDAGYGTVFVDIPEQSVEEGVVRLQVTEGRLEHVRVSGARYFSDRRILAAVPSLAPGGIPRLPEVQTQVADLNRSSPDLTVTPVLRPGAAPGTMDVDLKVKDQLPLHGSVELDNRATPDTRPLRVNVNLTYDNLFQADQSLSLQYQTAPQDTRDATVLVGTYTIPVDRSGDSVSLYALKSDSNVATLGTLGVIGRGKIFGGRYTWQLPASGNLYSNLVFGVDLKDFQQNVTLSSGGVDTPIKYLNWSILYAAAMPTPHTHTTLDFTTNFGIRDVLNQPAEFENDRYLANPNYFYLRFDLAHDRPLAFGTRLALRLSGQYTTEPLITNEQFAIGGLDSVRGYLESEQLGDKGVSGSAEVRSPSLLKLFGVAPREAYVYVFYDAGIVDLVDPLPSQQAHIDLQSAGFGLRLVGFDGFDAGLDAARAQIATAYEHAGEWRVLFRVRYGL
jgi:hemolysin activation/secretion protein